MAKRKRLSPAILTGQASPSRPGPSTRAPIAEISGDAAMRAAFDEVSEELSEARKSGRMVIALPLEAVETEHLVRDRLQIVDEDMDSLRASLHARGQQTPIEVQDLGHGRYGLISGWRRLMALRALQGETGEARFGTVQALVRNPDTAPQAYLAMVEENEIRAGLSFYERARIAVQAERLGVFPGLSEAVQTLFAAARAPKRSKIMSFTILVGHLDAALRFPAAIPEKLGLALAGALQKDPEFSPTLIRALQAADPSSAAEERAVLEAALRGPRPAPPAKQRETLAPGITLERAGQKVTLAGPAVDAALQADLRAWLKTRLG